MVSKLPKWVEYGAFTLSFLAGCINVVGLLGFQHQAISHLSGMASRLGSEILSFSAQSAHLGFILMSFVFGSIISGFMLSGSSLKLGRHYDSLLVIEGLFLFIAIYFLQDASYIGHYFASAACGLQNALATQYSGAVIRTTHLTGIFTDLGLMFGSALRKDPFDTRKFIIFMLIIIGFILGGAIGAILFKHFHFLALLLPASLCFLLAIAYRIYWHYTRA